MRAMSRSLLVIVDDLDVGGPAVALRPFETDPPPIIDSDAVLALSISAQRFEPVTRQGGEIAQRRRSLETVQLQLGRTLNAGKRLDPFPGGEIASALVALAEDHRLAYLCVRVTSNVTRTGSQDHCGRLTGVRR